MDALEDDLNTPLAISRLHELASRSYSTPINPTVRCRSSKQRPDRQRPTYGFARQRCRANGCEASRKARMAHIEERIADANAARQERRFADADASAPNSPSGRHHPRGPAGRHDRLAPCLTRICHQMVVMPGSSRPSTRRRRAVDGRVAAFGRPGMTSIGECAPQAPTSPARRWRDGLAALKGGAEFCR